MLFCLAIHDLLDSLQSDLILAYLDDVALGGEAQSVVSDFIDIENKASALGLQLNRSKCEVTGHTVDTRQQFRDLGVDIQETGLSDLILLGSPILPGIGVDRVLAAKRMELQTLSTRLRFMPGHDCLFLLRNIIAMPRLLYTLRTAPCTGSQELIEHDTSVSLHSALSCPTRHGVKLRYR